MLRARRAHACHISCSGPLCLKDNAGVESALVLLEAGLWAKVFVVLMMSSLGLDRSCPGWALPHTACASLLADAASIDSSLQSTCAMLGSIFGGIAAAPTLSAVPSSVATFAAFGYFIEGFTNRAGNDEKQLEQAVARRAKLQNQLAACNKEISVLEGAR